MKVSNIMTLLLAPLILAGTVTASRAGGNPATEYDADSWKTLIAEDCTAFFDGCNHCRRGETGGDVACTRKACAIYQKPHCVGTNLPEGIGGVPFEGRLVRVLCAGGNRLRIYYDEYVSGDQRVRLAGDEIKLVDEQAHTAYTLKRERAASGAKFANGGLEFWEHGGEVTLRKDGEKLYSGCNVSG
ncbi:MAG: MliC family protein [Gammaproteobacteria bacterium]|nr:MAG: MliC family protein [Gammaproteobacteria bacterium]